MTMISFIRLPHVALMLLVAVASGCSVGPTYVRPTAPVPTSFKEGIDWVVATPADALERGHWWTLFNDPALNELASRVEVSNQNVAAATAAYEQARALVREQRAALFPVVSLDSGAARAGTGDNSGARAIRVGTGGS